MKTYTEFFSEHNNKGSTLPFTNMSGLPKISSKKHAKNKAF